MEGRGIQANGDQETASLDTSLNLSLAPASPSQSSLSPPLPLPLPQQPFPTLESPKWQWPLEGQPPSRSSPFRPRCLRPTQLSQPPASQSLPPLLLPPEPLIFSSSPLPPPLRSLPAPAQRRLSKQLQAFRNAAPSMVGHCDAHGGSVGGGGGGSGGGGIRPRRSSIRQPLKEDPIPPPYPWATDKRATVHSLEYLEANGIEKISSQVCCKRCENVYTMEVGLAKVYEVVDFIVHNLHRLHNRAPKEWLMPQMLDCEQCKQEACVKPVTDLKKKKINWLFLFATQSLGYCTLEQLKYFCKHTKSHRTGAKDRVLHDTYIGLVSQLNGVAARRPRFPSSHS